MAQDWDCSRGRKTDPHSADDLVRSLEIQRDREIVPWTGHRLEALTDFALACEK
jgi:hypothetical protein